MVAAMQRRQDRALVSVPMAAALLGLNVSTVRNAIRRGEVPAVTINGRQWVARAVVTSILERAQGAAHDSAVTSQRHGAV